MESGIKRPIVLFWTPLVLLAVAMYQLLIFQFNRLPPGLSENSNDLRIYRGTGEAMLRGEIPYRDFFIEYPPGSLPAFVPPALLSESTDGYTSLFASEMALVLVATLVLVALAARRISGRRAWVVPSLALSASAVLLYPVAVTRYDAVVALTLAVAVYGAAVGSRAAVLTAYASLGFGTAAKLVPALATLPLAFVRRRMVVPGYAVFIALLALFLAPALLFAGGRFADSFAYHAQRGLQVESLGAGVLMQLGWVREVVFEFGAFEARGRGVELVSSLSLAVTAGLLLLTAFVLYRQYRAGRLGPDEFPRYAAGLILAFMLGSKVLSPQYMIWLLPLIPLSFRGLAGAGISALFVATCWTTTQVFPINYDDLLALRSPGPGLLMGRNVLLATLWGFMLVLPSGGAPDKDAP